MFSILLSHESLKHSGNSLKTPAINFLLNNLVNCCARSHKNSICVPKTSAADLLTINSYHIDMFWSAIVF